MNYKEAQDLSPVGAAVYGNIVMKDIVWVKGHNRPCLYIGGYTPVSGTRAEVLKQSDEWSPIEEKAWVFKSKNELLYQNVILPILTKREM